MNKFFKLGILAISILFSTIAMAQDSSSQVSFLKIDGIDGQSTVAGRERWIDVISFKMGAEQITSGASNWNLVGRGEFKPFVFVHLVDKATPKIQQFCMNGQRISKVKLDVCRTIASTTVSVLEVTLEDVKIKSATVKILEDNSNRVEPIEEVELLASKMTWKVTPVQANGTSESPVETSYDQLSNN